jgi:hypothetical protein
MSLQETNAPEPVEQRGCDPRALSTQNKLKLRVVYFL